MYLPREPSLVARPICGQHETASVAACNSQLLPTNQICELLSYPKKTKNPNPSPIGNRFGFFLFGGRGWIRTTEAERSRFTVCPHWPLGNTPLYSFFAVEDCLYILPLGSVFVNCFLQLFRENPDAGRHGSVAGTAVAVDLLGGGGGHAGR